jgi:rubredoxin
MRRPAPVRRAITLLFRERQAHPQSIRNQESVVSEVIEYKSWVCLICGWIYNEEHGLPDEGIAPGTRFADIPAGWRCPECDVGKEDFVVVDF